MVVRSPQDEGGAWRWFVATLCFIEFYSQFVPAGTLLWEDLWAEPYRTHELGFGIGHSLTLTFRAVCFAGIARSILSRTRRYGVWIVLAVGASQVEIGLILRDIFLLHTSGPLNFRGWPYGWALSWMGLGPRSDAALDNLVGNAPWLAMLIAGLWYFRSSHGAWIRTRQPWVVLAAAWCLGSIPAALSPNGTTYLWVGSLRALQHFNSFIGPEAGFASYAVLQASTALLLLIPLKLARSFALVGAGIALAVMATQVAFWWLVAPLDSGRHIVRQLMLAACVQSVELIGPWLAVAWFAWRVPMKSRPDDHSPYPRRYCGRCGYSLHGIDGGRCPECGCIAAGVAQG